MKGKFPTIVMTVMALVLALSLVAVVEPAKEANAGDLTWSPLVTPTMVIGVYPALDINELALSPNFATDKVMYASVFDFIRLVLTGWTVPWGVAKSSNSGLTWTACTQPAPAPAGPVAIAVAPDDPKYVVAADFQTVWASSDSGGTWGVIGSAATIPLAANELITSIDVGPLFSGVHPIAIGTANTAAATYGDVYVWALGSPPALVWTALAVNEDVTSVAVSPKYATDLTVVAVGSHAANLTRFHFYDGLAGVLDPAGYPVLINGARGFGDGAGFAIVSSDTVLPLDFNGQLPNMRIAFVGTNDPVAADVYRVRPLPAGAVALASGLLRVKSLDFVGTIGGSAALMAGDVVAGPAPYAVVAWTTDPWTAAPWWSQANKGPTGLSGWADVALAPDYMTSGVAFCGTGVPGAIGDESALSMTRDTGLTWNQISLIDTDVSWGIEDLAASPAYATDKTLFITTGSLLTGYDSLWKSTMGGTLWERIDIVATVNFTTAIRVSPEYATDKTVYWAETGAAANIIRVSSDDGAFFTQKIVGWAAGIADMVVEDGTTVYVASAATVGKSTDSASTWPTMGSTFAPVRHMVQDAGTGHLIMSGDAVIYVCTDTTTMTISVASQISGDGAGTIQWLAFSNNYATDKTIYAAGGGLVGLIWKIVGVGAVAALPTLSQIYTAPTPAVGLAMSDDGVIYCADSALGGGVLRSVNPEATPILLGHTPEFLRMRQGFSAGPAAPIIGAMWMAKGASNVLWILDVNPANTPVPGIPGIATRILEYRDIVPMTPSLTSPADGATGVGTQVAAPIGTVMYYATLEWGAVTGALGYGLQICDSEDLANPIVNLGIQANPDNDLDGWIDEDPIDGIDNDADGLVDEDPYGPYPTDPLAVWTGTSLNAPAHSYSTPAGGAAVLAPGVEYFWRVRVDNTTLGQASCVGRWSAARSFTTGPGVAPLAPQLLSPEPGDKDVGLKPTFTWTAVAGMTEYDFQLATDAGFTDKVVDVTLGDQQSYMPAEDLDEDTQYFWRVRGHDGTTTQWATGGFTTSVPTVTPIWVWIVIAIGAVVAIAVIVLIIRTRRPA